MEVTLAADGGQEERTRSPGGYARRFSKGPTCLANACPPSGTWPSTSGHRAARCVRRCVNWRRWPWCRGASAAAPLSTGKEPTVEGHVAENTSPLELIDVRQAVEPQMARLAVLHATARDIETLADALAALESCRHDRELFSSADERFHLALAAATGNALMAWLYRQINEVRGHDQWNEIKRKHLMPEPSTFTTLSTASCTARFAARRCRRSALHRRALGQGQARPPGRRRSPGAAVAGNDPARVRRRG